MFSWGTPLYIFLGGQLGFPFFLGGWVCFLYRAIVCCGCAVLVDFVGVGLLVRVLAGSCIGYWLGWFIVVCYGGGGWVTNQKRIKNLVPIFYFYYICGTKKLVLCQERFCTKKK
jgi:hypothetical protein